MLAGDSDGSTMRRALRVVAVVAVLGMGTVSCGDGSGDDTAPSSTAGASTTESTGLPSCREVNQVVVFVVFGGATSGAAGEATKWAQDPDAEPEARPGVAALASAYRAVGYQIMYVTLVPAGTHIGDRPVIDAVTVWLGINKFPVGDGVRVWAPPGDEAGDPSVALIEELAHLGATGVEIEAGYSGDQASIFPLVSGGVPQDRVFLVGATGGPVTSERGITSTPLSEKDLPAHVAEVQALEPICE
jgi:hypothetical protein